MRHHQREKLQRHQHTKQTEEKKTASEINEQQDKRQNFKIGYRSFFFFSFFFSFPFSRGKSPVSEYLALDGHGLRMQRLLWPTTHVHAFLRGPVSVGNNMDLHKQATLFWPVQHMDHTGFTAHDHNNVYSTWSQQCFPRPATTISTYKHDSV